MTLPYREHRFSPQNCEFVLTTRKFYPEVAHIVIVASAFGILTLVIGWERGLELWVSASIAVGVAVVSLGAIPFFFLFGTGQLGVENYLLGNISSIMGHVTWPPICQNVLADRAVTFEWAEIEHVVLRPKPWIFALNNLTLEIDFYDGRQRILRIPNLAPDEVESFVEVLAHIARRRGFQFHEGPSLHSPL